MERTGRRRSSPPSALTVSFCFLTQTSSPPSVSFAHHPISTPATKMMKTRISSAFSIALSPCLFDKCSIGGYCESGFRDWNFSIFFQFPLMAFSNGDIKKSLFDRKLLYAIILLRNFNNQVDKKWNKFYKTILMHLRIYLYAECCKKSIWICE